MAGFVDSDTATIKSDQYSTTGNATSLIIPVENRNISIFNCKKKSYEVFNLGSGKGISVLELIDTFQRVNKLKIPYFFGKRRKGDLPEYFADISKAKKILNWSPKKNLDQMCLSSWKFENSF